MGESDTAALAAELRAAGLRVTAPRVAVLAVLPARFETRAGDNHHHAVCRSCGEIWDVDCAIGRAPCLQPDGELTAHGCSADEAEVVFWGTCARCTNPAGQ